MVSFQKTICLLTPFFMIIFISSSHANTFQVGGKDGWTLHPSENYNTWSSRLRFLINDTLHFKYDDRTDSVLVVNKSDYDGCNANNPIMKMEGGDSTFKFDRSGPFYFITGNKSNCDQGQKLVVVVLALRNRSPPPSSSSQPPSPAVSPALPPSAVSPVATPFMSPGGSPELSPSGDMSPPASSPDGGSADSPSGGSTDGGSADSPGGESPPSPPGSTAATLPRCGSIITSVVTVMVALWGLN